MTGKALLGGLKRYAGWLLVTLLFPLLWLRTWRMAQRHTDTDKSGPAKVAVAVVASVLIAAGGFLYLTGFREKATEGMYDSLEGRMSIATGESAYREAVTGSTTTYPAQITIIEGNLERERAAGNNTTALEQTLADVQKSLAKAQATAIELAPNHALFLQVQPLIQDRQDAQVRSIIASSPLDYKGKMDARTARAYEIKDKAMADMDSTFRWMLWPSLVGAFFAPIAFAQGSIVRSAFVESGTVGYKPYPGKAAGLFLLLGAFGVPSIPFAAWTFMDMDRRSVEGQIAL
jgi:hypothetical protein